MAIKTYTYAPASKFTQVPRLGILAPGTYEIDESEIADLNSRIHGKDGAAFVIVKPAPKQGPA